MGALPTAQGVGALDKRTTAEVLLPFLLTVPPQDSRTDLLSHPPATEGTLTLPQPYTRDKGDSHPWGADLLMKSPLLSEEWLVTQTHQSAD